MARLQIHPIGLAVVIFGLLVWVIALGGLGATMYQCQKSNSYAYCAADDQWEWWSLWFEFSLLVSLFVTCFLESAFKRGQIVFLAFFLLATMCCMESAHTFLTEVQLGPVNVKNIAEDATNAAAAGFVMLCITNFVLLIILGKDFGVERAPAYHAAPNNNPNIMQFQTSAPV